MKHDSPTKPRENVPETDATYERTRAQTTRTGGVTNAPTSMNQPAGNQTTDVRKTPLPAGGKVEGNMKTEQPDGWDQAPMEATEPKAKRHPRPDGLGGSDADSVRDRTKKPALD